MHLCLVSNEYPPAKHGGIGSCNHDLARGLARAGHRVTVIGLYNQAEIERVAHLGEKQEENIRVIRIPLTGQRLPYRLRCRWNRWRLKRHVERTHLETPFDLLECADYGGWLPWGGPKTIPSIVRLHGTNLLFDQDLGRRGGDPIEYGMEVRTLKSASYWLGVSQFALNRTLQVCGLNSWPGGVIYNSVDTDLFAPDPSVPVENGLIVFVNSINPKKGVEELMQAANLLLPDHPTAHLVLIGADSNNQKDDNGRSYTDQLKSMLSPAIANRVVFTGRIDRYTGVLPFLKKAQVCCYPSHAEMFAIAPLEAMACGKPVLFSLPGAGPEAIENGVSGFLCDPKSPQDIADKLRRMLDDATLGQQFGKAARERVMARFSTKDWIPRNVAFFEEKIREWKEKRSRS